MTKQWSRNDIKLSRNAKDIIRNYGYEQFMDRNEWKWVKMIDMKYSSFLMVRNERKWEKVQRKEWRWLKKEELKWLRYIEIKDEMTDIHKWNSEMTKI